MSVVGIIITSLILAAWIFGTVFTAFSSERIKGWGWRRWVVVLACCSMAIGAVGFLGAGLSACGGLNWLPSSFEWPVGYAEGVISTPEGWHIVPHDPTDRIQVYDADWNYVAGWPIPCEKHSKILHSTDGNIHVLGSSTDSHYVFDTQGRLISKSHLPRSYYTFPEEGESMFVPTSPWLMLFSHPFYSWGLGLAGMVTLMIFGKYDWRKSANKPEEDETIPEKQDIK